MMTINCICGKPYNVQNSNVVQCPYCFHVWKLLCVKCTKNYCECLRKNPKAFDNPILGKKFDNEK